VGNERRGTTTIVGQDYSAIDLTAKRAANRLNARRFVATTLPHGGKNRRVQAPTLRNNVFKRLLSCRARFRKRKPQSDQKLPQLAGGVGSTIATFLADARHLRVSR